MKQYLSWRAVGIAIVFVWFMFGGVSHFTDPDFFVAIMPPYVPYHLPIVYISGVFEIAGAIGILLPQTRRLAGLGLFVLTICVTPANIYMWQNPELYPDVPEAFLSIRLVVQCILLAVIWFSTRSKQGPVAESP